MRVVVCDDDPVLRSVASGLAEQGGHDVLAETDSAHDALELVERFGADVLILDLTLVGMSGREALAELRRRDVACAVIVFTAYDGDPEALLDLGARAVVVKPDVQGLAVELSHLAAADAQQERRSVPSPASRLSRPDEGHTGPTGVGSPTLVAEWLRALRPGDAVLALAVDHVAGPPPTRYGGLVAADRLLALARTATVVLRAQDRVGALEGVASVADHLPGLACVLVGGGRAGAPSAYARIAAAHLAADPHGQVRGGWSVVEPEGTGAEACERAVRSLGLAALGGVEAHRLVHG